MMYCVDLRSKITYESVLTIFKTDSHSLAWDVANNYNEIHGNTEHELEMLNNEDTEGWTTHPYWATVYDDATEVIEPKIEEEKKMKQYAIEKAEEFCREALDMPPIEQFESGEIDESLWYDDHKIYISVGDHQMALDYNADNVNELDRAIKEMYEVEMDIKYATTGNTVGSEYRLAELKDILRVGIYKDWDEYGWKLGTFKAFIQHFIAEIKDRADVMKYYDIILEDIPHYTTCFKCDFGNLNMRSMRCINSDIIKRAIGELIGTEREFLYGVDGENKSSDITFMMDYTFKNSGELIGWWYGEADEEYINGVIEDYKENLFE